MPPLGGIPQTLDNAGRHKMNSSLLQEWERNWSSDIWIYKVAWGKQLQLKDICLKQILEFVKICWAEAPTHGEIFAWVLYWFRTTVGRRVLVGVSSGFQMSDNEEIRKQIHICHYSCSVLNNLHWLQAYSKYWLKIMCYLEKEVTSIKLGTHH